MRLFFLRCLNLILLLPFPFSACSARANCVSDTRFSNGPVMVELSAQESATHAGRRLEGCLLEIGIKNQPKVVAYTRWNYFCQKKVTSAKVRIDSICCDAGEFPPPCMAKGPRLRLPTVAYVIVPVDLNASNQSQIREGLQSKDSTRQLAMLRSIEDGNSVLLFQSDLEQLLKPETQIDVAALSAALLLTRVEDKLSREVLVRAYFRYAITMNSRYTSISPKRLKSIQLTPSEEAWFTQDDFGLLTRERGGQEAAKMLEIFSAKKVKELFSESARGGVSSADMDVLQYLPKEKFPTVLLKALKEIFENKTESQSSRDLAQRIYCRFSPENCTKR